MTNHAKRRLNERYKYKKKIQAVYNAFKHPSFKCDKDIEFKMYNGYIWLFKDCSLITVYKNYRKRVKIY